MKILIVEDHEILSRNLVNFFALKNIKTDTSFDGKDALYKGTIHNYDAIILDINLPEIDGLEVCQTLREKGKDTPIIMLTSRSNKSDIISGLNVGADDYLSKPFDYDELLARIKTLTRRNLSNKSNTLLYIPGYTIDLKKIEVCTDTGEIIKLSNKEFELLKYFAQNKGKVMQKSEIYEKVWGEYDNFTSSKTVDVYIGYLRKKLGKDIIETKKGFGYSIKN